MRAARPALLVATAALLALGCAPGWRGIAKIGVVAPHTGGDRAAAVAVHEVVRLAVIARNERGGFGGRQIELVSLDDEDDPNEAARRARELARDPDVLFVIGHFDTATATAAAAAYRAAGLPALLLAPVADEVLEPAAGVVSLVRDDPSIASSRRIGRALAVSEAVARALDAAERVGARGVAGRGTLGRALAAAVGEAAAGERVR